MTTKNRSYTPWETSSAWEQHYAELRTHVARQLSEWGTKTGNDWPDRANIIEASLVSMTPAWFSTIVGLGNRGLRLPIELKNMPEVVQRTIDAEGQKHWVLDTYWQETMPEQGNKQGRHAPALTCYIPLLFHVCVVRLGCAHSNVSIEPHSLRHPIKTLEKYHCHECGHDWEVDRGD